MTARLVLFPLLLMAGGNNVQGLSIAGNAPAATVNVCPITDKAMDIFETCLQQLGLSGDASDFANMDEAEQENTMKSLAFCQVHGFGMISPDGLVVRDAVLLASHEMTDGSHQIKEELAGAFEECLGTYDNTAANTERIVTCILQSKMMICGGQYYGVGVSQMNTGQGYYGLIGGYRQYQGFRPSLGLRIPVTRRRVQLVPRQRQSVVAVQRRPLLGGQRFRVASQPRTAFRTLSSGTNVMMSNQLPSGVTYGSVPSGNFQFQQQLPTNVVPPGNVQYQQLPSNTNYYYDAYPQETVQYQQPSGNNDYYYQSLPENVQYQQYPSGTYTYEAGGNTQYQQVPYASYQ